MFFTLFELNTTRIWRLYLHLLTHQSREFGRFSYHALLLASSALPVNSTGRDNPLVFVDFFFTSITEAVTREFVVFTNGANMIETTMTPTLRTDASIRRATIYLDFTLTAFNYRGMNTNKHYLWTSSAATPTVSEMRINS
jgi:hypothetical protein